MSASRLLVRGGTVIDTEPEPTVHIGTDVLVEGDRIAAVGPNIDAADAEVIDATDRIVLPGFVDTHRHVWQSVLRGTAIDIDLAGYRDIVLGQYGPRLSPADVRVANLVGALECLDSGITMLHDYSHIQYTAAHTDAAIAGLRESGIRAVFGYAYPAFDPRPRRPDEIRRAHREHFGRAGQTGGGLVTMALAPVGPGFGSIEDAAQDWLLARELGVRIGTHVGSGQVGRRPIAALAARGLLGADTTYVHGNALDDDELTMIADSGGTVTVAPAVEAQMGHGAPMIGRLRAAGIATGLGVDVVTSVAGDMFSLMRAALFSSHVGAGPRVTTADVLRMATLGGAETDGLADRIGSLRPGKQADIVLLRTDTANMTGWTHDPIAATVTAANPSTVDTVLVAGDVRKRDGRLVRADLAGVIESAGKSAARLAVRATSSR
ncbi:MAG TPA: amidohydrolase family protein [Pseudonocardiaceae bacterium]|nr:amidohydrolase family protein [Pseudonocardiaceae bacterium]